MVDKDEHPRPETTLEGLAKLKTPFRSPGTVTAGNASGVNDGAAAMIIASETANTVTNQALQLFGARGYSRDYPLERMVRDARMFTIAGGTAQVLRTLVASRILETKLPQTRNGYLEGREAPSLAAK